MFSSLKLIFGWLIEKAIYKWLCNLKKLVTFLLFRKMNFQWLKKKFKCLRHSKFSKNNRYRSVRENLVVDRWSIQNLTRFDSREMNHPCDKLREIYESNFAMKTFPLIRLQIIFRSVSYSWYVRNDPSPSFFVLSIIEERLGGVVSGALICAALFLNCCQTTKLTMNSFHITFTLTFFIQME